MQKNLQIFVELLTKMDLERLLHHYIESSEVENVTQLGFMFKQGQIKSSSFGFYQELATSLITNKGFPSALMPKIKTHNTLSFFTPALQLENNFNKTDTQQRNVLHYIFTHNEVNNSEINQPPFNYLRSMMLFGSNVVLRDGLCQRDQQNLTPIEAYLFTNKNLSTLVNHELTALLALIEIESNQQTIDQANYTHSIKMMSKLYQEQGLSFNNDQQRCILIATYYSISIKQVVSDIYHQSD